MSFSQNGIFHRIKSVSVVGGFLDKQQFDFSQGLNCIIGARGTGKTTILELIRYTMSAMAADSGKFLKGVLLTWVLLVGWMLVLSIPVYEILWKTHQYLCIKYLPEGKSFAAALFAGWLNGLIISASAMACRFLIFKLKPEWMESKGKT